LVETWNFRIVGQHVIQMAGIHGIMEAQADVVADNPLGVILSARVVAQQDLAQFVIFLEM
jgi:hypothetical protein